MIKCTLCYIENGSRYLMLLRNKKDADINRGKWIGVGGKLEPGETPEQCALREIKEETGLTVRDLSLRGVVTFLSDVWDGEVMYLYTARDFEGHLSECSEGELHWIDKQEIFDLPLWDGDRIFLKKLLTDAPYFEMTLQYKGDRLQTCVTDGQEIELIDVYNEDGSPAGYVADRDFVHWRGLWHVTAHIWIVRYDHAGKPQLLLQLRSAAKRLYPGYYDISSAGHISAGESMTIGALRELEEELGIPASPDALELVGIRQCFYDDDIGEGYHDKEYCHVFLYRGEIGEDSLRLQLSEVDGVMWMDFDDLMDGVRHNTIKHCIELPELEMIAPSL